MKSEKHEDKMLYNCTQRSNATVINLDNPFINETTTAIVSWRITGLHKMSQVAVHRLLDPKNEII